MKGKRLVYNRNPASIRDLHRAIPAMADAETWLVRMGRRLFQKFVRAGRDGRPWRAAEMDFWNKRHGFLTPIVAKVHQGGPWGRAVDGRPWRAAGTDFWNKRHGFLAPIVAEVRQSGPWEQAVDGRPWRAAEMNFWNKRLGFLALIVSKVCQIGPCMLTKPLTMFISRNPIDFQWVSRK